MNSERVFEDEVSELMSKINELYERNQSDWQKRDVEVVHDVIERLTKGELRVASPSTGQWIVHEWLKKAILLYFRMHSSEVIISGAFKYFDKIPVRSWDGSEQVRVVPPATVRVGAHIEKNAILMPSYVNIGAYVGAGTMVDTWATVGSCAQIGRNVHLSGGVGIGGVLEPLQAKPVVIEDHAFIGSRAVVVEGVRVCEGAVLGSGVVLTASTKIIDVTGEEPKTYIGLVPSNSVVIPGSLPKKFPAGEFNVPCALIIGKRSPSTDKKTSLNQVLRDFEISV